MLKKLLSVLLFLIPLLGSAQKSSLSIGVDGGIPLNLLKYSAKFGVGVDIKYQYQLSSYFSLTGSAGMLKFGGKEVIVPPNIVATSHFTMIPIQVGLKAFPFALTGYKGLYLTGELGVHSVHLKVSSNLGALRYLHTALPLDPSLPANQSMD